MKNFNHVRVGSFEEASQLVKESKVNIDIIAGGTDLLGVYKDRILETYPETVVSIKNIPGADQVEEKDGMLCIGAEARLSDIAVSPLLKEKAPALSEAAHSVASPLIRNVATIGGNICQDVRCWYYRYPDSIGGAMHCKRKGGETCYAINGDNRYHSAFGGMSYMGSSCMHNCPAGTDIPGYMEKLREGDWDAAANIIMKYNPMPVITSHICPHTCQGGCNQNNYGDSVNIHAVERSLGDYILEYSNKYYKAPAQESGKSVAVIGAGPGGLSAAFYLRKAGHDVTIYDRMKKAGGVLQYGIPHYRLPKHYVDDLVKALESMGIKFKFGVNVGKDITMEDLQKEYDNLYVGTGAWKQPILGLEGEDLTEFGLNFLVEVNTYLKKAIGNEVLVCGGGNVAMDVALTAIRLGAKKVKLVCLEQEHEMPASPEEVARAKEEGVEIFNGFGLSKIVTNSDGMVNGLEAIKCVSVYNEEHHFSPIYDKNEKTIIKSDTIILATGQRVDIDFLGEKLASQIKSARGLIDIDEESYQTSQSGIYAGGDVVTGPNVAIRAIKAGRIAATNMNQVLGSPEKNDVLKNKFKTLNTKGIQLRSAMKLPELPVDKRTLTDEDAFSLSNRDAIKEAGRCMNCGCYAVNPSDTTPVLVMMDAEIVTTERILSAVELFTSELTVQNVLHKGELVIQIRIPVKQGIAHYDKKRVRDAIDFAIVSLASRIEAKDNKVNDVSLVLGGVAPVPYRLDTVESYLRGNTITEDLAMKAANLAIKDAHPLLHNEYKLAFIKSLVFDTVMRAAK